MFSIDGIEWPVPCDITRVCEVRASDISGLMLDKSYFNDVLGAYLSYTVTLAVPFNMRDRYAQIYEALTSPVDGHVMVLPYNDGTITITARITNVSDVYVRLPGGGTYWKGVQFTAVSNYPTKTMTRGEMMIAGRAPWPEIANPAIGDTYTYTEEGWVTELGNRQ